MKYCWKTRPYRHQVAAVKQAIRKLYETGGFALLMAPRTGKTKSAIDIASIMHKKGDVDRVLVVCPNGVIGVWIEEIATHCGQRRTVTLWDRRGRRFRTLPRWGRGTLDFVIINYDAFSHPTSRKAIKLMLKRWQPHLMILDESHRIKTPSAKKTTAILGVAYQLRLKPKRHYEVLVPYRLIMTGTAVTKAKRVYDLYSQWKFVNRDSPLVKGYTLAEFKEEYGVWTRRSGYEQWLRNRPEGEIKLRSLVHAESFAITRDECFDLPPTREQIIPVELDASAPYYDEMAAEMVAQLKSGEITWAKIPLVQRLRLHQLTSGIARTEPTDRYPEGRLVRVGREKLEVLEDRLSDLYEADEKVVIAARFRGDISSIVALHGRLRIKTFELHGGIDRRVRDSEILSFRRHQGPGAMIMQPGAGSEGIDLSTASIFIWYSLVDSWVQYTQGMDRIALSSRPVIYEYLEAVGTIDVLMREGLADDGDVVRRIQASPDRLLRNFKNEMVAR